MMHAANSRSRMQETWIIYSMLSTITLLMIKTNGMQPATRRVKHTAHGSKQCEACSMRHAASQKTWFLSLGLLLKLSRMNIKLLPQSFLARVRHSHGVGCCFCLVLCVFAFWCLVFVFFINPAGSSEIAPRECPRDKLGANPSITPISDMRYVTLNFPCFPY